MYASQLFAGQRILGTGPAADDAEWLAARERIEAQNVRDRQQRGA